MTPKALKTALILSLKSQREKKKVREKKTNTVDVIYVRNLQKLSSWKQNRMGAANS